MIRRSLILVSALTLAACGGDTSPEDELRAVVAQAEAAAEARDASGLFELLSDDYRDPRGNAAEAIKRYLRGYLVMHQAIYLLVRIDEIELQAADLARLRATVAMLGSEAEAASAWDLAADVHEFDITLAREGGEWRVTRADWARAGLTR